MEFCIECGKEHIVNKTYKLGIICNWLRLNKGKTIQDYYNSKIEKFKPLKQTILKQTSKKENKNKSNLTNIYNIIDKSRDRYCTGCGQTGMLSHSHLISRTKDKNLESDPNNIVYDCQSREIPDKFGNESCHDRWESMDAEKMKTLANLDDRLNYIKTVNLTYYNTLVTLIYG